jgi:predicted aspartyl protease
MKFVPLAAFAAALLTAAQAHAACRLSTVEVPVTMDGLRPLVPAKIDGRPVKLLLDSGAFISSLDETFVAQQGVRHVGANPIGSHIPQATGAKMSGAAGAEKWSGGVRANFEFGGSSFLSIGFLTVSGLGGPAGLLGQNVLHGSDDEYDFKNGVMRLVQPQDCASATLAYWVKPGETFSMAELEPSDRIDAHNVSTIWINGEKMRAFFDTGADTSFITRAAAARAGVKVTDPAVKPGGMAHGVDGAMKTWVAPFASIKIGDEEIKNTRLSIGDSHAEDFDVLIGADFFLAHHVYVANSQGRVYFTYSGGPVFRAAPAEPAKATSDAGAKPPPS